MDAPQQFWIFQYTNGDRTGRLLEDSQNQNSGGVVNWLWSGNRKQQPVPGDLVFFLRSGTRPKDYPSDQAWRGIVGFGTVAGQLVTLQNAKSDEGIPVETIAHFPDRVLPDYLIWHDHRVATAASLFGQQGTNFLINREVAVALADELETPEDGVSRADMELFHVFRDLLDYKHRVDVVTRTMDNARSWVDRDAALSLHLARAISATSTRRSGELTWTHLFFGVLLRGKGLQKNSRKNVAALFLYQLAAPNGDNAGLDVYWESTGPPITKLKGSDAVPIEKMSPSAERTISEAKALSKDGLISIEALLAGLLNTHPNDNVYQEVFKTDREGLIERIYEQAAANLRASELQQFLAWVNRADLTDHGKTVSSEISTASQEDTADIAETGYPVWQIPNTQNDSADRGQDLLDVEEEAKAFARLIASTSFEPPLAIGVFGPWGSGKTFFMNQIEKAVTKLVKQNYKGVEGQPQQDHPSFHNKIVRIPFNA